MNIASLAGLALLAACSGDGAPPETGTLIVLNKSDATASLIDLATGKSVKTLTTGFGPHEVAVSPNGKTAVVCNYGEQPPGASLTVLDLAARSAVKTIDLGEFKRPHGIEFLGNDRVVVTSEAAGKIVVVSVPDGKVTGSFATGAQGSHMLVVGKDKETVYTANIGSGSVSVISLVTDGPPILVPTGAQAEGIDISPDGKEVWISNRQANTVSVLATSSNKITHTLESSNFPIRVKFTPDGKWVIVTNAVSGTAAVFDAAAKTKRGEVSFAAASAEQSTPIGVLVHPGGKTAYIACSGANKIAVVELASLTVTGWLTAGNVPDGLGFSKF